MDVVVIPLWPKFVPDPTQIGETTSLLIEARPTLDHTRDEMLSEYRIDGGCDWEYDLWRANLGTDDYVPNWETGGSVDFISDPDSDGSFWIARADATFSVGAYWGVIFRANELWFDYQYNHGDTDVHHFHGTGENASLVEVLSIYFDCEIAAKPNSALALNDEYIAQSGVVGILDGWNALYKSDVAPSDAGDWIGWEWKNHSAGDETYAFIDYGSTYEAANIAQGDYDVRSFLDRADPPICYSTAREIQVGKLKFTSLAVIQESANYVRQAAPLNNHFEPPANIGANQIQIKGVLEWDGIPQPANIKQGIIQGGTFNWDEQYPAVAAGAIWNAGTVSGVSTIAYLSKFFYLTAGQPELNDAAPGHYLQGDSSSAIIGNGGVTITDVPGPSAPSLTMVYPPQANGTITVQYVVSKEVLNFDFTDYLVAEVSNTVKPQFVPFQKLSWKLHLDSTGGANTGKCEAVGTNVAPTKPSDGSATSSDTVLKVSATNGPPANYVKP
jgi:hypothetical protein